MKKYLERKYLTIEFTYIRKLLKNLGDGKQLRIIMEWKYELEKLIIQEVQNFELREKRKEHLPAKIKNFFDNVVIPVFNEIKNVFEKNNRKVDIEIHMPVYQANIFISREKKVKEYNRDYPLDFLYFIQLELSPLTTLVRPGCAYYNKDNVWFPHHSYFGEPEKHVEFISSITKDLIISNFMYLYENYIYLGE